MKDNLLEALEKTYAQVPAGMFKFELIIFISSDWSENLINCNDLFYRGIEVKIIPEGYPDKQKIIIMKKSDYENPINYFKKVKHENELR